MPVRLSANLFMNNHVPVLLYESSKKPEEAHRSSIGHTGVALLCLLPTRGRGGALLGAACSRAWKCKKDPVLLDNKQNLQPV